MQAILLAGGLGTRLRTVVSDRPKPMALIEGKPFMEYVVHELSRYEIRDIVFAVGYKGSMVEEYFGRLMLTNAHNEWLTVLIDEGLLGAAGYIGLMVTAIGRYLKAGREDSLAGAAGMGILAYTVNNIFSFQQVMSTSAVFLILGIGEACLRSNLRNARGSSGDGNLS